MNSHDRPQRGRLSDQDHNNLEATLRRLLGAHKQDLVTTEQVVGGLMQMFAALDIGNTGEARNWMAHGLMLTLEKKAVFHGCACRGPCPETCPQSRSRRPRGSSEQPRT